MASLAALAGEEALSLIPELAEATTATDSALSTEALGASSGESGLIPASVKPTGEVPTTSSTGLRNALGTAGSVLAFSTPTVSKPLAQTAKSIESGISETFKGAKDTARDISEGKFGELSGAVKEIGKGLAQAVGSPVTGILDFFKGLGEDFHLIKKGGKSFSERYNELLGAGDDFKKLKKITTDIKQNHPELHPLFPKTVKGNVRAPKSFNELNQLLDDLSRIPGILQTPRESPTGLTLTESDISELTQKIEQLSERRREPPQMIRKIREDISGVLTEREKRLLSEEFKEFPPQKLTESGISELKQKFGKDIQELAEENLFKRRILGIPEESPPTAEEIDEMFEKAREKGIPLSEEQVEPVFFEKTEELPIRSRRFPRISQDIPSEVESITERFNGLPKVEPDVIPTISTETLTKGFRDLFTDNDDSNASNAFGDIIGEFSKDSSTLEDISNLTDEIKEEVREVPVEGERETFDIPEDIKNIINKLGFTGDIVEMISKVIVRILDPQKFEELSKKLGPTKIESNVIRGIEDFIVKGGKRIGEFLPTLGKIASGISTSISIGKLIGKLFGSGDANKIVDEAVGKDKMKDLIRDRLRIDKLEKNADTILRQIQKLRDESKSLPPRNSTRQRLESELNRLRQRLSEIVTNINQSQIQSLQDIQAVKQKVLTALNRKVLTGDTRTLLDNGALQAVSQPIRKQPLNGNIVNINLAVGDNIGKKSKQKLKIVDHEIIRQKRR